MRFKISILKDEKEIIRKKICSLLKIHDNALNSYKIVKKSIDSRDKNNIFYVYEFDVDVDVREEKQILSRIQSKDIFETPVEKYIFPELGNQKLAQRPIIVGSGPAGLFCGYMLAEAGFCPIILEQGDNMENRVKAVEDFFENNRLDSFSNIQFGEGGAGTFSDGKLNTMVKDKLFRGKKVFEIFVENGAPENILYLSKPHIGTDLLRDIIVNIREKIISMGGEFHYRSQLTDLGIIHGKLETIEINHQKRIPCSLLVLAIGHSARDTFYMLYHQGLKMKSKNFAVGVRVEHSQKMINESQYGKFAHLLPPASYKLTYQSSNGRGVYSFCMCPGGFVVNASSEVGRLAVNGMSNHKRDGENANSALVVTVTSKDFGSGVLDGVEFQRELEKQAFSLGNGLIPLQLYRDFVQNKKSEALGKVIPSVKGGYSLANLNDLFSSDIQLALKEAIPYFGKKIKGFDCDDMLLFGVESRTSSPVIMERNEEGVSSIGGVYPCGEGAGYAGGITTAAMDGIAVAEKIAKKYYYSKKV